MCRTGRSRSEISPSLRWRSSYTRTPSTWGTREFDAAAVLLLTTLSVVVVWRCRRALIFSSFTTQACVHSRHDQRTPRRRIPCPDSLVREPGRRQPLTPNVVGTYQRSPKLGFLAIKSLRLLKTDSHDQVVFVAINTVRRKRNQPYMQEKGARLAPVQQPCHRGQLLLVRGRGGQDDLLEGPQAHGFFPSSRVISGEEKAFGESAD